MKPNSLLIPLFLLSILLAGCSNERPQVDPELGNLSLSFEVEYNGTARGDDNDLWARIQQPAGDSGRYYYLSGDTGGGGGAIGCPAHDSNWEGKPWWLEISLYDEKDGNLVNRQRWPSDCLRYWVHVDENAQMTLHEGGPPSRDNRIPGFSALATLVSLGLAALALRRR